MGSGHTHAPHTPRQGSPACTPRLQGGSKEQASLLLYSSYSSTSTRFPSSALPFNRMSLNSGDMK